MRDATAEQFLVLYEQLLYLLQPLIPLFQSIRCRQKRKMEIFLLWNFLKNSWHTLRMTAACQRHVETHSFNIVSKYLEVLSWKVAEWLFRMERPQLCTALFTLPEGTHSWSEIVLNSHSSFVLGVNYLVHFKRKTWSKLIECSILLILYF